MLFWWVSAFLPNLPWLLKANIPSLFGANLFKAEGCPAGHLPVGICCSFPPPPQNLLWGLQSSPIIETERQYDAEVKGMDSEARLTWFKAGYATVYLRDLGQLIQPPCALVSSYVKQGTSSTSLGC